ncbi:MAG: sodium:proton antiporter, partial [Clostridia bacterium]|nr:sodium:proton antiporter [Clostridia bacterium]
IGIPLSMGFVSKYRFALAAFERQNLIVPTLIVLAISTVLNTLYFARVVIRLYTPSDASPAARVTVQKQRAYTVSALAFMLMNIGSGVAAEPLVLLLERGLGLL